MQQILLFLILFCGCCIVTAAEWSGYVGTEFRVFPKTALSPIQDYSTNFSLATSVDYYHEWNDGRQSLLITPFLRLDQRDSKRTHFDLREFSWIKVAKDWELRVGIRQVFWGVAESVHLVDIINQTDLVENLDTEDKLGQAMINLALIRDWGTLDLFILPGFRERTFPGAEGRIRSDPRIDGDNPIYESAAEDAHIDFAVRWSHVIGYFDIGLSHFYGTSRNPRLVLGSDGQEQVLVPHYDIIHQTGLDLQATVEEWLWKFELIYVSGQSGQDNDTEDENYISLVGGFEYTFTGVFETVIDVGIVSEYIYDNRGVNEQNPFEDEIFFGVRLGFNDVQTTALLAGIIFDRDSSAQLFSLEASRRMGDSWRLELEGRYFSDAPENGVQSSLRNDDYLQLQLNKYF